MTQSKDRSATAVTASAEAADSPASPATSKGAPSASLTRRQVLRHMGIAGGGAAVLQTLSGLGIATPVQAQVPKLDAKVGGGRRVVILGGGVGGLISGYELIRRGFRVTILEARHIIGGRSLTLRPGDTLVEEPTTPYRDNGQRTSSQTCTFKPADATGFDRPYLNAGPGRIPSAHTHILDYCKALKVPLEVYVMESRSNLVNAPGRKPSMVNRHIGNDARGWIAQTLYEMADRVPGLNATQQKALRSLLIPFGNLGNKEPNRGKYVVEEADKLRYVNSTRAGYKTLPGVEPGVDVDPFDLSEILDSDLWKTQFYQPEDFLWQSTLFQPVGGMDRIEHALASAFQRLGGIIRTRHGATSMRRRDGRWFVETAAGTTEEADICISNIPLPLLQKPLGQGVEDLDPSFRQALETIFAMETTGIDGFLAPTCKVGWQARRNLWQTPGPGRVVPIYGGISWTHRPMTQLWYPSDRFHDDLGVLTGAYNYSQNATDWGVNSPGWRLGEAKKQAEQLAGPEFARGLGQGLSIAWQNISHLRGGWAQWQNVPGTTAQQTSVYSRLLQGDASSGLYVCGDQMSELPGWKEGAAASALYAVHRIAEPQLFRAPRIEAVPNSKVLVEGLLSLDE